MPHSIVRIPVSHKLTVSGVPCSMVVPMTIATLGGRIRDERGASAHLLASAMVAFLVGAAACALMVQPILQPFVQPPIVQLQSPVIQQIDRQAQQIDRRAESTSTDMIFPTTNLLATGTIEKVMPGVEVYAGSAKDLDLSSFLDDVPADMKGERGLAKDAAGVARIKEQDAAGAQMTAAEKQAAKQAEFKAKQAAQEPFALPKIF